MSETHTPRLLRLGDLLAEWDAAAEEAHEAYTTGAARGPVTALPKVDEALGGFLAPGLHVLHGAPGAGKTAFALQTAATCGCPALFVTCEMSPLELLRRLAARVTGCYLGRFKTGELEPERAKEYARQAAAASPDLAIADATRAHASVAWILAQASDIRGAARHMLVVVDSLHSWAETAGGELPEYEALNFSLAGLRHVAAGLDCPTLAVTERNRQSMTKGGMSAGAGTRRIEYGAESVLDMDRDPDAKPDATGHVDVTLKLPKNRNGAPGKKIELRFHGARQAFTEDSW